MSKSHRRNHGVTPQRPSLARPDQGLLQEAGFQGQPMALPHQDAMEGQFGMDLSEVQAMYGNQAAMDSLGARAFATGDLVAFDSPDPQAGQVAEEVAHVVQQGRAQGQGVSDPGAASEHAAHRGHAQGTGSDASLHRDAAEGAEEEPDVAEITISDGTSYTVTEADVALGEQGAWEHIARAHGMMERDLIRFNQHVETVGEGDAAVQEARTPTLAAGVVLHIPSSDELAFARCRERTTTYREAVDLYGTLAAGSNLKILAAARFRASGRRGEGYGNLGVDGADGQAGPFLSPNPDLVGASKKRSEELDGQREYKINWNATAEGFWKCSIFLHDTLFQAGYQPHVTGNAHYLLAGQLDQSDKVTEIPVSQAGPGALWQRDGGSGSDESHNAILTSFVTVTKVDEEWERWEFSILGAEREGAGESARSHVVKKGTNEADSGEHIRFFAPATK